MARFESRQRLVERKTFIAGRFNGKYIGYLNAQDSDRNYERIYSLEILTAEIVIENQSNQIRNWRQGESEEFQKSEMFTPELPESLVLCMKEPDGSVSNYDIHLHDGKLLDFKLSNQVYEDERVFGDITGNVSGYLRHFESETFFVEIDDDNDDDDEQVEPKPSVPEDSVPEPTYTRTGKVDKKGCYIRYQYYYSDGTTYWGQFQETEECKQPSCLESIVQIGIFLLFLAILIPVLIYGWKILLIGAAIVGLFFFFPILRKILLWVFTGLVWLYTVAMLLAFLFGIFNLIIHAVQPGVQEVVAPEVEESIIEDRISEEEERIEVEDRILSNKIVWNDLLGNEYEMDLRVRLSDYRQSLAYRNGYPIQIQSEMDYNAMVHSLYRHDRPGLDLIYESLDSIRLARDMGDIDFAFMVVSMVQDIPYTLILDSECDPSLYRDPDIRKLIREQDCEGNIKFGLLSPIEFSSTLKGDCDTRTLLIFTILDHFNYDVVMLGSSVYQHSIIGIDLPLRGLRKNIMGKEYVVWETTAQFVPPGILDPKMSNMRFWNVSLISN